MPPIHFHKELEQLKLRILEMAARTERALDMAIRAMLERDRELAGQVVAGDAELNRMASEIDEFGLKLLALEQPVAMDLRFIVGSMRVSVQLERIGNQAANVASRSALLSRRPALPRNPRLEELAVLVKDMLRSAIVAYNTGDIHLAGEVCQQDDRADELNLAILKDLIDYMLADGPAIERSVHTIITARCLERVGDLSTNIAENIFFMVKGLHYKSVCQQA
jgi:phosphate transport system protein